MVRMAVPSAAEHPEQSMAGKPFRATFIWNSIIHNLQTHVEVKHRRHNLKSYQDCFVGSEAVDVVLSNIITSRFFGDEPVPRFKAVRLCQALMDARVFQPVLGKVLGKEKKRDKFQDSSFSLYRFLNPVSSSSSAMPGSTTPNSVTTETGAASPSRKQSRSDCSPSCESQDVPRYFTHSCVRRNKLLEDMLGNLNFSSGVTAQMLNLGISQECLYEVWHQQALCRLLQLIELPLLEELMEGVPPARPPPPGPDREAQLMCTSSYLDREVLKAFSEAQADEWMSAAVDCLEFVPDELVVEVSRGWSACGDDPLQCKRLLHQALVRHYGPRPPLLSNYVFDIHSGISELLVNGKLEAALEALQLSLRLQDAHSREELRRLLRFMAIAANQRDVKLHREIENRMALKRSFSSAIVHSRKLSKGKVDLMVLFMMDKHKDLFKIPVSLQTSVSERLRNIVTGKDPDSLTGSTFCSRVGADKYSEGGQKSTKEEIRSLLRTILERPDFSPKERRRLLGQFYKAHPEAFVQYFGNKLSQINMLLQ